MREHATTRGFGTFAGTKVRKDNPCQALKFFQHTYPHFFQYINFY